MKKGQRVVIRKNGLAWQGEVGIYVGDEKTSVGLLHKVELENGFSGLFARKELSLLDKKGKY